ALGRAADVWGYSTSYMASAVIVAFAVPFFGLSRSENAPADHADATTDA
ncbi:MAG: MFS transporter, partial [Acidimicrobiia bacterium]|nr:MFS transporter [Acidimicrobiia bacterium]